MSTRMVALTAVAAATVVVLVAYLVVGPALWLPCQCQFSRG